MSKLDDRMAIRQLRAQVARLEEQCKQREDRLISFLERAEPFFPYMSEAAKRDLEKYMENN